MVAPHVLEPESCLPVLLDLRAFQVASEFLIPALLSHSFRPKVNGKGRINSLINMLGQSQAFVYAETALQTQKSCQKNKQTRDDAIQCETGTVNGSNRSSSIMFLGPISEQENGSLPSDDTGNTGGLMRLEP